MYQIKFVKKYLECGFMIIPNHSRQPSGRCSCKNENCASIGKHPILSAWQNKASNDLNQITAWLRQWPNMNIGVLPGSENVILDIDPRNGGDKYYSKIIEILGDFNTPAEKTGGGGLHVYFKKPRNYDISSKVLAPGVELKTGIGSNVIIAPSVHASGKAYEWLPDKSIFSIEFQELPIKILELCDAFSKKNNSIRTTKIVQKGNRNNVLFAKTCELLRKNISEPEVTSSIYNIRNEKCESGDDPISDDELNNIISSAKKFMDKQAPPTELPYTINNGRISRTIWDEDSEEIVYKPICNFCAVITQEIEKKFPNYSELFYEIEVYLHTGEHLGEIVIPASQFPSMDWICKFGARPIIYPSHGIKEEVRAAIQQFSFGCPRVQIFMHIGWTEDLGYITSSGAIYSDGLNSEKIFDSTEGDLAAFELPPPPQSELKKSFIDKTLSLLEAADEIISFPSLAAVFSAPLFQIILEGNFSLYFVGMTGSFKSTWAALMQSFWGKIFSSSKLPISFTSTRYAIEKTLSLCPSTLVVLDDFVAEEMSQGVITYIIRGIGNHQGRARLKSDLTTRPAMIPRCLAVITAEDYISLPSIRARLVILEFERRMIDVEKLTHLQEVASKGILATTMSSYVQWISGRVDKLKALAATRLPELQRQISKPYYHGRTASNLAQLIFGFETFIEFAVENMALSAEDGIELIEKCKNVFSLLGNRQSELTLSTDPATKFIECIALAFFQKKAHLAKYPAKGLVAPNNPQIWGWIDRDNGDREPGGDLIGWIGEDNVILYPDAAYKTALAMSRSLNSSITTSKDSLWRFLAQKGLILRDESDGRNLIKKSIPDGRERCLVFPDEKVFISAAPLAPLAPLFEMHMRAQLKNNDQTDFSTH